MLAFCFLLPLFFLPSSSQQLNELDVTALRAIKTSLSDAPGGAAPFFSSWSFSSTDPCSTFAGIICSSGDDDDEDGGARVSSLMLGTGLSDSPGLIGVFPPAISNLTFLSELVIYPGHVSGQIPSDIGYNLRRLRLVSISGTLISGGIPDSISELEELHTLDLSHNRLQGPIPQGLFSSNPSLRVLILAGNGGLYGEIPDNIASTQLLHLDLRDNSFTGKLPSLPPSLRYLSVSTNAMSGSLDSALGTPPPELAFLDASSNTFTGTVPHAIFSLSSLSSILLQNNNLSGGVIVPASAEGDDEIEWEVVDLSHNKLTGEAPAGLATAASLYLNDNEMTGAVPEEYARKVWSGSMTTFYAQKNYLTSFPSPAAAIPLPDSVSICLSFNCMDPPPESAAGCPGGATAFASRPADECR